ncbi:hypothetical protein [Frigoriflavimonas asaccharolytica]|uniref:Uncharacterized protein n=1 Tax=Frigoriflavimonas asaccharolytica TaxID=2735899 RepID=A0A8J8GDX7_9FLAO|nr:hypothetical protein [Frigoriflavimonas asaccharolytica]NRS94165.1 hypothetical protein [Frigoriflavimonas asaccharolytica]
MIENLYFFFRINNQSLKMFPLRFLLLIFYFFFLMTYAQNKVDSHSFRLSDEINISEGVILYDYTSPNIPDREEKRKDKTATKKSHSKTISEQVSEHKIAKIKKAKDNQEKSNDNIYYNSFYAQDLQSKSLIDYTFQYGKMATTISANKILISKSFPIYVLQSFFYQAKKQINYHILSYLQFGKYNNSSLRAPPFIYVI